MCPRMCPQTGRVTSAPLYASSPSTLTLDVPFALYPSSASAISPHSGVAPTNGLQVDIVERLDAKTFPRSWGDNPRLPLWDTGAAPGSEQSPWLVAFTMSPSSPCKPCHSLRPFVRKAADAVQGKVRVGTVHCDVHKALCAEQLEGRNYYPILKVLPRDAHTTTTTPRYSWHSHADEKAICTLFWLPVSCPPPTAHHPLPTAHPTLPFRPQLYSGRTDTGTFIEMTNPELPAAGALQVMSLMVDLMRTPAAAKAQEVAPTPEPKSKLAAAAEGAAAKGKEKPAAQSTGGEEELKEGEVSGRGQRRGAAAAAAEAGAKPSKRKAEANAEEAEVPDFL